MVAPKTGFVEKLFAEHHRALQAFFYRRIRSKSYTVDLVQEVYVRMLRVSDVEAIRNPEAYLFTVASNLAKEHSVLERRETAGIDFDDSGIRELLCEQPTVDRQLDVDRRVARLRVVLAQLSPKCRAAVVLRYRHELSYEEIGKRLGVSSNMVKKYLAQALAHCRCRMTGVS
jgi:RNA polymerase sigma-70 factor (ECF subfamily)